MDNQIIHSAIRHVLLHGIALYELVTYSEQNTHIFTTSPKNTGKWMATTPDTFGAMPIRSDGTVPVPGPKNDHEFLFATRDDAEEAAAKWLLLNCLT